MVSDPFTVEIIREQLNAAAEESFIAMGRASQSPIIYEVLDYACALTDPTGDLIAQANGVPGFLGTLTYAVKAILEKHPLESMHPGDIFITNDPYIGGGNHLSDVALISPIFFDGQIAAFSVNKAHWTEVGGMAAGSWTTDSTEIYQEGLQFPAILLYQAGQPIQGLIDLIAANVRTPDRTLGDLYAGVAALRSSEKRVIEILEKNGLEVFRASVAAILDHGERSARHALAGLPHGQFFAEEWIDDDGLTQEPVYVCARVTVTDRDFVVDYTGSAPQVRGPVNCTRTRLFSACRSMFKAITDPQAPVNEGWFRPLRVVCPEGTIFTARRPAPVSTYWETGAYAVDLIWRALFPALPDRLSAGHHLSVCGTILSGVDENGRIFILVEPQAGGWGATAARDGVSGLVPVGDGETYIMPVEVCEQRYPLLVDRFTYNLAPAGAGRYRGGFGLVREYRVLCERAELTATFGRHRYPPWGAAGGHEGSPNGVAIIPAGQTELALWRGKLARYPLNRGDVARLVTGVGGGYGDPLSRDPEMVRNDVCNELLTVDEARQLYGVALHPVSASLDQAATAALRRARAALRDQETGSNE
jgi:N-methylhydantoinase B